MKYKVLVTRTTRSYYEVSAKSETAALESEEYGKPLYVKKSAYKSVFGA
jgi:hypothetical protein